MAKNLMRFGLILVGVGGLQHVVKALFDYSIVDKIALFTGASWVATTLYVVAGAAGVLYAVTEWK